MQCILVDQEGVPLQGYSPNIQSVEVTEENTFTTLSAMRGKFNVVITGTFEADIEVQATADGENYITLKTYDAPVFDTLEVIPSFLQLRIGCPTGGFTSGTAQCNLLQ